MHLPPWSFPATINTSDFDGVIYFGKDNPGLIPNPEDIIITGRSFEEREKTEKWCERFGVRNVIYFSPIPEHLKTREISGFHKAMTLRKLLETTKVAIHFEDDPIQKEIIEAMVPEVKVVHLVHNLTRK